VRGALPCLLTACGVSTGADLAEVPAALVQPCAVPQVLAVRPMMQAEVEIVWGRDRAALRDCGARQALLVEFLEGQRAP
jgi:hypothetical protein